MKKISAYDFYLKVCIWTFCCLILAGICGQIKAEIIKAERSSQESSAFQAISTINRLQKQYAAKHRGKFAPNFYELVKAENLDKNFCAENPVLSGYVFEMKVSEPTGQSPPFYSVTANPLDFKDDLRHFYIDSTLGSIRGTEENRPARAPDPAI